jgi:sporulation-control protein
MSFFKKALASIGVGATKVDAQFTKSSYTQGEQAEGVVVLQGGNVEQRIDDLRLTLCVQAWYESNDSKASSSENLAVYSVGKNIKVGAGERLEVPFSIKIPEYTPKTGKKSPVWVYTGADIPNALDPIDKDYLDIVEHDHIKKFLKVISGMGFRLREVEVERDVRRSEKFYSEVRFLGVNPRVVQEYEWSPSTEFRGKLDEIEALFYPDETGLKVWFTKDKKQRGFESLFENDTSTFALHLSLSDLNNSELVEQRVRQILK